MKIIRFPVLLLVLTTLGFFVLSCGGGDSNPASASPVLALQGSSSDSRQADNETGPGSGSSAGSLSQPAQAGTAPRELTWQASGKVDVSWVLVGIGWDKESGNPLIGNTLVIARIESGSGVFLESAGWLEGQVNCASTSNPQVPGTITTCQSFRSGALTAYTLALEEDRLSCVKAQAAEEDEGETRPVVPLWNFKLPAGATLSASEPLVADPAYFDREISLATPRLQGEDARLLQYFLNRLGYREVGAADGIWGPASDKALRHYQQDKGLPVTGKTSQEFWDILFPALQSLD